MDLLRIKRYKEKLERIELRSSELEEWSGGFSEDEKSKLACYKAFQEIAEAAFDLLAMMLKDDGSAPEDDYSNAGKAARRKLISAELGNVLKEANGLRNRITHEYNGLNDKLAIESALALLPKFGEFVEVVKKWLRSRS